MIGRHKIRRSAVSVIQRLENRLVVNGPLGITSGVLFSLGTPEDFLEVLFGDSENDNSFKEGMPHDVWITSGPTGDQLSLIFGDADPGFAYIEGSGSGDNEKEGVITSATFFTELSSQEVAWVASAHGKIGDGEGTLGADAEINASFPTNGESFAFSTGSGLATAAAGYGVNDGGWLDYDSRAIIQAAGGTDLIPTTANATFSRGLSSAAVFGVLDAPLGTASYWTDSPYGTTPASFFGSLYGSALGTVMNITHSGTMDESSVNAVASLFSYEYPSEPVADALYYVTLSGTSGDEEYGMYGSFGGEIQEGADAPGVYGSINKDQDILQLHADDTEVSSIVDATLYDASGEFDLESGATDDSNTTSISGLFLES